MRNGLVFAYAVAAGLASPAMAAPVVDAAFTGTVSGIVISGQTTQSMGIDEYYHSETIPLTGSRISIDFTADVTYDFIDEEDGGRPYPRYVVNTVAVTITPDAPLGIYQSRQTNDYANYFGAADYTGNATNSTFVIGGTIDGEPDVQQYVTFAFSAARSTLSPLTGSGTASTHFYVPSGSLPPELALLTIDSAFSFELTSGFVTGPGQTAAVPEPATWSLMLAGMGLIGVVMRKSRKRVIA